MLNLRVKSLLRPDTAFIEALRATGKMQEEVTTRVKALGSFFRTSLLGMKFILIAF